jgi:hypothetical protein
MLHSQQVVGKHLEGNRSVGNSRKNFVRERLVIANAGFSHYARVRREAGNPRIPVKVKDLAEVGTVD